MAANQKSTGYDKWEFYAPPIALPRSNINPTLSFDLRQQRVVLSADAISFLQSSRFAVRARREEHMAVLVPVYSTEAASIRVDRTGAVHNGVAMLTWLRCDTFNQDRGIIPLTPRTNGVLELDYGDFVSKRAARLKAQREQPADA